MNFPYKHALSNLFLTIFALILGLGVCELIARVFIPDRESALRERKSYSAMMKSHPILRRVLKPNYKGQVNSNQINFSVDINSKGLRDREFSYEKKEGVYRILFLGDSFTFGYGVESEESFPKLLEKKLKDRFPERKLEVINAAVPAWGSSQERDFLIHEGVKYKPDAILVGFFLNDVEDTWTITSGFKDDIYWWEKEDADLANYSKRKTLAYLPSFFTKNSDLYFFLRGKAYILRNKIHVLRKQFKGVVRPAAPATGTDATSEPGSFTYTNLYYPPFDATEKKAWDSTMNDLLEINKIGNAINAKVVFVYLPDQFVSGRTKLDGKVDMGKPDKMFFQFMRENNMESINLIPLFKTSEVPALYIHDGHFSVEGNRLAANGIFQYMKNWERLRLPLVSGH